MERRGRWETRKRETRKRFGRALVPVQSDIIHHPLLHFKSSHDDSRISKMEARGLPADDQLISFAH